jgi:hypothetical protein
LYLISVEEVSKCGLYRGSKEGASLSQDQEPEQLSAVVEILFPSVVEDQHVQSNVQEYPDRPSADEIGGSFEFGLFHLFNRGRLAEFSLKYRAFRAFC